MDCHREKYVLDCVINSWNASYVLISVINPHYNSIMVQPDPKKHDVFLQGTAVQLISCRAAELTAGTALGPSDAESSGPFASGRFIE